MLVFARQHYFEPCFSYFAGHGTVLLIEYNNVFGPPMIMLKNYFRSITLFESRGKFRMRIENKSFQCNDFICSSHNIDGIHNGIRATWPMILASKKKGLVTRLEQCGFKIRSRGHAHEVMNFQPKKNPPAWPQIPRFTIIYSTLSVFL